jgi:hypothetical protein
MNKYIKVSNHHTLELLLSKKKSRHKKNIRANIDHEKFFNEGISIRSISKYHNVYQRKSSTIKIITGSKMYFLKQDFFLIVIVLMYNGLIL